MADSREPDVEAPDTLEALRERLEDKASRGEALTAEEQAFLHISEDSAALIPARLKVARPTRPRSPAQIEQAMRNVERINAEHLQTGPRTPGGKAASSRNATKHGLFAERLMSFVKPCRSTCPEYPCALVDDGSTRPGSHCLERHEFAASLDAVSAAIHHGKLDDFKDLLTYHIAGNLEVVNRLRELVLDSPMVMSIKQTIHTGKDGDSTETVHHEYKASPVLLGLSNLIRDMQLTPRDALITPREVALKKDGDETAEALATLFAAGARKLKSARPPAGPDPADEE